MYQRKYDIVIAGAGPAGIAAAVMCETRTTNKTVDTDKIRNYLIARGVEL